MQCWLSLSNRKLYKRVIVKTLILLIALTYVASTPDLLYAFWPFAEPGKEWQPPPPQEKSTLPPKINEAVVLKQHVSEMANELTGTLSDPDPEIGMLADGLIVCTFVDLKKLYRTSSFGRYIAEQLMNEFQSRNYTVVELRKSTSVLIQEKRGEYGLSRDPAEIGGSVEAGAMLTGTYTVTDHDIIVNAKIIDNRTAKLLSSATMIFPRNQLSNRLLADSSSAVTKQPEPMYMKRLEM